MLVDVHGIGCFARFIVWFAYQLLLWLALPFVPLRLWWRARREPAYRERLGERFGRAPEGTPAHCIWFHAVSAGETIAVAPLISALADEYSALPFLVTTMTPTGAQQARQRLGDKVAHAYAPYDFPFAVRAFFAAVQPRLLVLVETELWPNLIGEAHRRRVPVLVINARLSERSARAYGRVPGLTRNLLNQIGHIACQYPQQARRFEALGAHASKVSVLGSVKFDIALPGDHEQAVAGLRTRLHLQGRRVWVAASTHAGEDSLVLEAHRRVQLQLPNSCLLLVPRHLVRGADIRALSQGKGFSTAALSAGVAGPADVVVCDSFGLLQTLYGLSDAAFIGGSLVPKGGHNPIEAAICQLPLAMGPAAFNFTEVVQAFAEAGCLTTVYDAPSLAQTVLASLGDAAIRQALGQRALRVVQDNQGATGRLLALLRRRIQAAAGTP